MAEPLFEAAALEGEPAALAPCDDSADRDDGLPGWRISKPSCGAGRAASFPWRRARVPAQSAVAKRIPLPSWLTAMAWPGENWPFSTALAI